jgi:titin
MWRYLFSFAVSASATLLAACTDQPVEPTESDVRHAAVSKTQTLTPPGNPDASGVSETQIDVSWVDNSTNETSFELYRSTTGTNGAFTLLATLGANVIRYSDRQFANGTVICYQLRAVRVYGSKRVVSGFSNIACAVAPPAAPSNLSAVATPWPRVALTWQDNASLETNFQVLRSTDGENGTFNVVYWAPADAVSVSDALVTTGTRYCYRVQAAREYPTSSPPYRDYVYSAVSNTACATPPPPSEPPPSAYQVHTWPGNDATVAVALTWTDTSMPPPAFRAYRSTDGGGSWTLVTLSGGANGVYVDRPVANEQLVCHRVVAYNVAGDGPPSSQACTTVPAAPTNLTIALVDDTTVELRWTDNSAVEDGYMVAARWYRATMGCYPPGSGARDAGVFEGEGVWAELGPNVTTYRTSVIDHCDPATIYWFSVVARKDGGISGSTDEVSTLDVPLP